MHLGPPIKPPRQQSGEEYRLYFFEGGTHITFSHEFIAENDDAAIKTAEAWREGRKIELWNRARMVKSWH